jgi:Ca-activated chloride channel family protein
VETSNVSNPSSSKETKLPHIQPGFELIHKFSVRIEVDPLRYQRSGETAPDAVGNELMLLKLRYKLPQDSTSQLITQTIQDDDLRSDRIPSTNLRFAAAVATFGMVLRDSEYKGNADYDLVMRLATEGKGEDPEGYRGEFIRLVEQSRGLITRK